MPGRLAIDPLTLAVQTALVDQDGDLGDLLADGVNRTRGSSATLPSKVIALRILLLPSYPLLLTWCHQGLVPVPLTDRSAR